MITNSTDIASTLSLMDNAPEGLKMLAEWGEDQTQLHYVSIDELDEFVEGINTPEHTDEVLLDGIYLQGVLPAVDWWIDVADALLLGRNKVGTWGEPEFNEQQAKLIALLNDVLSGYAAALAESPYYDAVVLSGYAEAPRTLLEVT
jgi:hypothetical protein